MLRTDERGQRKIFANFSEDNGIGKLDWSSFSITLERPGDRYMGRKYSQWLCLAHVKTLNPQQVKPDPRATSFCSALSAS